MHKLVETYGKQLIRELMDIALIGGTIKDEQARNIMIRHNIISKRTKIISATCYSEPIWERVDGRFKETEKIRYKINIRNGRGTSVFYMTFADEEIQQLLEDTSDET